ncbi:NlpC/P60 family protein [Pontixanthobacter aquaemixtae]|uniref:Peptidoglycan endopeptidase n=1 Tax=Pontixanthobacter aquaemixtae TaxID=1958940 RepID=A0A844ZVM7_9SPHN|nr:NlpC/P60 family protein [Pontixanthobacter aquaemixtae]MXO91230.1 peptidoglycan endopeptidase [Pontixanthobacter aquaemixtae]
MSDAREAFAAAAEALVDTPFRLHGRSTIGGLDCVGLVEIALKQIGRCPVPIPAYGLRNANYHFVPSFAARNGFAEARPPAIRGDVVATRPGPAQLHLLIAIGTDEFVHAHAGLRRVARLSGPLPWPKTHHFRLKEDD